MDDKLYRDIFHIVGHLLVYTFTVWNFILGVWLLLKWIKKNFKLRWSPVIKIEGTPSFNMRDGSSNSIVEEKKVSRGSVGPIEVDINRNISVGKADKSKVKMDETIKGKVKTQKEKLKKLRGK